MTCYLAGTEENLKNALRLLIIGIPYYQQAMYDLYNGAVPLCPGLSPTSTNLQVVGVGVTVNPHPISPSFLATKLDLRLTGTASKS